MKRNLKILIISAFLAITPLLMFAQAPPLPDTNPETGKEVGTGGPEGAPIGNGTFILLTLAMAYVGRKVYVMRTEEEVV